jgi:hypothetical protein
MVSAQTEIQPRATIGFALALVVLRSRSLSRYVENVPYFNLLQDAVQYIDIPLNMRLFQSYGKNMRNL